MSPVRLIMPQVFEKHQGQAPENYRFIAQRSGTTALYRPEGVDIVLVRSKACARTHQGIGLREPPELPLPSTIGR